MKRANGGRARGFEDVSSFYPYSYLPYYSYDLNPFSVISLMSNQRSPLSQIGRFMQFFSESQLTSLPLESRVAAISSIGSSSLRKVTSKQMQMLKRFALKNVERKSNDSSVNRTDASSLDELDLVNMGAIKCGLEEEDIEKLSETVFHRYMLELARCAWGKTKRQKLYARATQVLKCVG